MNNQSRATAFSDAELKAGSTKNTSSVKKLLTYVKALSILCSTNDGYGISENGNANNHKQQNQHENFGSHINYDPSLFTNSNWGRQLIAAVF